MMKPKRVALYLRVSTNTGHQTVENQRLELEAIAKRSGWQIVATFADHKSGAKGRDKRPGLDAMMNAATKREFDMVVAWSIDRLGRSLQHLVQLFGEFQALGIDMYLHQQHVDSSTPSGRALLQMSGVFCRIRTRHDPGTHHERPGAGQGRGKVPRSTANQGGH
jgi:DNA invertase Pin-like site-specific DNA recombinase